MILSDIVKKKWIMLTFTQYHHYKPPGVVITRKTFFHGSGQYWTHFCREMPRNSMLKTKFQTKLSIISYNLKRSSGCYTKVSNYVKREAA